MRAVPFGGVGDDFFLGELVREVTDGALFFGELEVHGGKAERWLIVAKC